MITRSGDDNKNTIAQNPNLTRLRQNRTGSVSRVNNSQTRTSGSDPVPDRSTRTTCSSRRRSSRRSARTSGSPPLSSSRAAERDSPTASAPSRVGGRPAAPEGSNRRFGGRAARTGGGTEDVTDVNSRPSQKPPPPVRLVSGFNPNRNLNRSGPVYERGGSGFSKGFGSVQLPGTTDSSSELN